MDKLLIDGKEYPIKIGFGAIRLFCERKGIEFYEFFDRVAKYNFENINNEVIDDLAEFVLCFIARAGECPLSKYDVIDWMLGESNADTILKLLTQSIGQSKNLEAPQKKGQN